MTTLQQVIESVKNIKVSQQNTTFAHKKGFAVKFLGKFKGITPKGKTSTEYIKELRNTLYGKLQ